MISGRPVRLRQRGLEIGDDFRLLRLSDEDLLFVARRKQARLFTCELGALEQPFAERDCLF